MQPLQFHPILKRIRWGGRRLGSVLGKPIGDGQDWAESWEIADCGSDQSLVAAGPYSGWSLARLVAEQRESLLGRHCQSAGFPLLVKFLDAHDRLSVQVHPDDARARRLGCGTNGKTEGWVILDARPGSRIWAGLKSGVDRNTLEAHLDAGTIEACLHDFPVKPGDCVFVPAGTVHAIGEGILLVETQQPSDVTFRLFDWGRVGADGKPRPLHRGEAIACINFDQGPVLPVVPQVDSPVVSKGVPRTEALIHCPEFVLRRHTLLGPLAVPDDDRFRIFAPVHGVVRVQSEKGETRLRMGSTVLIPASARGVALVPADESTADPPAVLEIHLP